MANVNGMAKMLTLMMNCIREITITANTNYVDLNMLAYCQIKTGHQRQSVNYILLSLCIFPSRYNAASGYMKIVLFSTLDPDGYQKMESFDNLHLLVMKAIHIGWVQEPPMFLPS
jgi:hypothetical protein